MKKVLKAARAGEWHSALPTDDLVRSAINYASTAKVCLIVTRGLWPHWNPFTVLLCGRPWPLHVAKSRASDGGCGASKQIQSPLSEHDSDQL